MLWTIKDGKEIQVEPKTEFESDLSSLTCFTKEIVELNI